MPFLTFLGHLRDPFHWIDASHQGGTTFTGRGSDTPLVGGGPENLQHHFHTLRDPHPAGVLVAEVNLKCASAFSQQVILQVTKAQSTGLSNSFSYTLFVKRLSPEQGQGRPSWHREKVRFVPPVTGLCHTSSP